MFTNLNYNPQMKEEKPYIEEKKMPQIARLQGPVRGLTDMPMNGASTSGPNGNAGFARQDSLALAASYQQRDRERQPVDFMETELDLDNYLACFTDLDVPADNVDFDDMELQKVNILYDGEQPYQREMNGYERHVTYGPGFRKAEDVDNDAYKMNCEVKTETPDYESTTLTRRPVKRPTSYENYEPDYSEESSEMSDTGSASDPYYEPQPKKRTTGLENYKPTTRARKYHLKPETEKAQPTYQLKRARNNDAVRKSRNKAKELQKKKEEEHSKMKKRIAELEGLLNSEREARRRDKELIENLLRSKNFKDNSRHALENCNK